MTTWYLESTKVKGLRFKILKLDKATMRATLQGDTGVPFEHSITQETLDKLGYVVAKGEAEEANI